MSEHEPHRPRIAVALEYDGKGAPKVSAKGAGAIAEQIIELAETHGVPLQEDRNLVQLLARLDLDAEIPPELYRAVAEIIAFAYLIKRRFPPGYQRLA